MQEHRQLFQSVRHQGQTVGFISENRLAPSGLTFLVGKRTQRRAWQAQQQRGVFRSLQCRHASHRQKCKAGERNAPLPAKQNLLRSETSISTITKITYLGKYQATFYPLIYNFRKLLSGHWRCLSFQPHLWYAVPGTITPVETPKYDHSDKMFPNYQWRSHNFLSEASSYSFQSKLSPFYMLQVLPLLKLRWTFPCFSGPQTRNRFFISYFYFEFV